MISEFSDVSLSPKTNIIYLWRHQNIKRPRKYQMISRTYCFGKNIKNENVGKDGHRTIMKIRITFSWKSWIWEQYLPESMKLKFGNSGSISINKHEMDFRILETLELCNFATLKLWNQESLKPGIRETSKPRNQETKKPRKPDTYKSRNQKTKKLRN